MIKRWIPWNFIIKRAAKAYGIMDPLTFLARLRRFAQPSEVQEPIELLRAGIIFHARGLINTKAIQHNLDWVWPYWVQKQFNPRDVSFVPRAFSFSHINLTHRNWTGVGRPDVALYPIVDPRGLVTVLHEGWSLDFWILRPDGSLVTPSVHSETEQSWDLDDHLAVTTTSRDSGDVLTSRVFMEREPGSGPVTKVRVHASGPPGGWLVLALRPYNPEGVQFIERVRYKNEERLLRVNGRTDLYLHPRPEKTVFADYHEGDVCHALQRKAHMEQINCSVGMATGAALFPLEQGTAELKIDIPMARELRRGHHKPLPREDWKDALAPAASLEVPDPQIDFLYRAALRSLVLLSAEEIVPGPFTYKRFWFRDACLMLHALLCAGLTDRSERILSTFPGRQKISGFFQSQEGEWDSNGQVLWLAQRFRELTGRELGEQWTDAVRKATDWIERKRLTKTENAPHEGLLPAGFSAEHFGPNDYYYWDDFWAQAGLQAGTKILGDHGQDKAAATCAQRAESLGQAIRNSLDSIARERKQGAVPASPYRRLDSGAIGSLVADYPLGLTGPNDPEIEATAEYLFQNCLLNGGFFQDMIHSGINAYLTLCLAQTLLRRGDGRFQELVRAVADLATSTGQWPEAIHPLTLGGCMGDGHHGWAAAEWVMMIRNMFVREEENTLILGSGIFPEWFEARAPIGFGPTPTPYGPVQVRFEPSDAGWQAQVQADWHGEKRPAVEIRAPGFQPCILTDLSQPVTLIAETT